jgi:hypothetical protein
MKMMRALVVLGLLLAPIARAEGPGDVERAKESFKAGATAYGAGEYLAAIQAFDAAYALTPLPPIAFSLAQAHRRQYFAGHQRAHLDRAIALFRRYVDQVQSGGRRADALDALSQLEPLAAGKSSDGGPESEAARPTRLMIICEAPGARVALDDDGGVASPLIREVPPGPHHVAVSAPGFFPVEREVSAVVGELIPMTVALRERPSTLAVKAPREAELYVDGSFAGRGGPEVRLELPSGAHRLVVAEKGHRVSAQSLELERGTVSSVAVELQQTTQRRASNRLFIGGGLALGAGVVLGALAVRSEVQAKDFLARRQKQNVTASELNEYEEDQAARGRYRTAAVVALGASAAMLATAAFLHELDNPEAQELYRAARPADGARPPESAHLQVAPLFLAGGLGAVLQRGF